MTTASNFYLKFVANRGFLAICVAIPIGKKRRSAKAPAAVVARSSTLQYPAIVARKQSR
jgi:hypothetical protein